MRVGRVAHTEMAGLRRLNVSLTTSLNPLNKIADPIWQGVRPAFGAFSKDGARGLRIRCDWGSPYIADAWINEVKWLGMTIAPSYVGEPERNGVIERFIRTLKEQRIYLYRFQTLQEARRIIEEFIERYNTEWLIERLGYRTPARARAEAQRAAA